MSVREYIGARYVPVFADPLEWNASNTYEPLTIVLYQGNSYTSRQAVPAGIEITNTAYWAQTGNYNAQIEQYRQEVQALDTEIDNLLPISVANGGTGATDAAGARDAIDAAQSNGASNTLYDAELAIAENAADIADLQDSSSWNPGDTFSINALAVGGFLTGTKDVYFTIPLTKPIHGTPTIAFVTLGIRQNGSYPFGFSNGKPTVNYQTNIINSTEWITVNLTFASAAGINNESISVFAYGTVTVS